ncbi:hypothetical protein ACQ4PT_022751 [Festuca glaucescens]
MMTRADALLQDLRRLSPNLVVVTEQEADHNGAHFKACVERHLLREEIRDIVSSDGVLRWYRHEKVEGWAPRMDAAGFAPAAAMRQDTVAHAAMLAQEPLPGGAYRISWVNDRHLFICHDAIPMFSISTWHAV